MYDPDTGDRYEDEEAQLIYEKALSELRSYPGNQMFYDLKIEDTESRRRRCAQWCKEYLDEYPSAK